MKYSIVFELSILVWATFYQPTNSSKNNNDWTKIYRASATKVNDLVGTKLEVKFDYNKQWMYGKAWITLHPHFYATDSLKLDAKNMAINKAALVKASKIMPLQYRYDSRGEESDD